jgi:hypothetical protein
MILVDVGEGRCTWLPVLIASGTRQGAESGVPHLEHLGIFSYLIGNAFASFSQLARALSSRGALKIHAYPKPK